MLWFQFKSVWNWSWLIYIHRNVILELIKLLRPRKSCPNFPHYSNWEKIPPKTFQSDLITKFCNGVFLSLFGILVFCLWLGKKDLAANFPTENVHFCFVLLSTIIDIGVDWCESGWDGSRGRSRQHPILLDLLSQHRRKHFDLAQFFYMFQYFNHNWKLQHHTNQQFAYSFSSAAVIWPLTQMPKRYSPIYWEWASPHAAECEPETVQKSITAMRSDKRKNQLSRKTAIKNSSDVVDTKSFLPWDFPARHFTTEQVFCHR